MLDSRQKGCRSSLISITALCPWARHINPCLVLVQPRKTRPDITEKLLTGASRIKTNNSITWHTFANFGCYPIGCHGTKATDKLLTGTLKIYRTHKKAPWHQLFVDNLQGIAVLVTCHTWSQPCREHSGSVVVFDSKLRGCGFEPHHCYCVVQDRLIQSLLITGSTQEDLSQHNWKIVDWDVKNQIKQNITVLL